MILEKFYGILNLHVKKNKSCRLLTMKQISSQTKNLWGGGKRKMYTDRRNRKRNCCSSLLSSDGQTISLQLLIAGLLQWDKNGQTSE